jgi:hypothetical protein
MQYYSGTGWLRIKTPALVTHENGAAPGFVLATEFRSIAGWTVTCSRRSTVAMTFSSANHGIVKA